jgi:hypothetical protein
MRRGLRRTFHVLSEQASEAARLQDLMGTSEAIVRVYADVARS